MSGLVGNSRRHFLSCRGSYILLQEFGMKSIVVVTVAEECRCWVYGKDNFSKIALTCYISKLRNWTSISNRTIMLWFILIVIVRPLSVCLLLFVHFIY